METRARRQKLTLQKLHMKVLSMVKLILHQIIDGEFFVILLKKEQAKRAYKLLLLLIRDIMVCLRREFFETLPAERHTQK